MNASDGVHDEFMTLLVEVLWMLENPCFWDLRRLDVLGVR